MSDIITYFSKFILQLSEQTHQLRELLKKDSLWGFTVTHRNQFDKLRSIVSETIYLKLFDPKLQTKITCDSSKFGIDATLQKKNMSTIGILLLLNQAHVPLQSKITIL